MIRLSIFVILLLTLFQTVTSNYHSNDGDCQCQLQNTVTTGARLAYLITVHDARTITDAKALIQSIAASNVIILIHIDVKFTDWNQSDFISNDNDNNLCGATVVIESKFDCQWGTWSMNEPTHWSMKELGTRFENQWDVYINLSGDSLAVYTPQTLANLFANELKGMNFVTSSTSPTGFHPTSIEQFPTKWHKRNHYSDITTSTIYFGSQWMILTREFVNHFIESLDNPKSLASQLKQELQRKQKLMSDETYIPTLLMNTPQFNSTLPSMNSDLSLQSLPTMTAIRYERMDEHMPLPFEDTVRIKQRYDVTDSSSVPKPRVWGPYYLGVYDLGSIRKTHALFIRKVTKAIDDNLHLLLPVSTRDDIPNISWPQHSNLKLTTNKRTN